MRARLGRIGALAAACATVVMAASAPAASATVACSNVSGSGSSLQEIVQLDAFIPGFTSGGGWKTECMAEPMLRYVATSSGTGLKEWGDGGPGTLGGESPFPAYVGTDVGPEGPVGTSGTQLYNMVHAAEGSELNKVLTVPVAQSAVAVVVSLPKACVPSEPGNTPTVKDESLEELWLKDEKYLTEVVEGLGSYSGSGCMKEFPLLESRAKASGTTAGFKRFLDDVNSTGWGSFVSTPAKAESQEEWPLFSADKMHETGNETGGLLAEKVYDTPNSIGYADLADAVAKGFTATPVLHGAAGEEYYSFFVEVQNNLNNTGEPATYVSPSEDAAELKTSGANCEAAAYNEPEGKEDTWNEDWSGAKQTNWGNGEAYPICTLTFDLAWHHYGYGGLKSRYESKTKVGTLEYNTSDAEVAATVRGYLKWVVTKGQESTSKSTVEEHQYDVLPSEVKKKADSAPFGEIEV